MVSVPAPGLYRRAGRTYRRALRLQRLAGRTELPGHMAAESVPPRDVIMPVVHVSEKLNSIKNKFRYMEKNYLCEYRH